ncbi:MAG: hypothetical protein MJE66_01070 [Proteobacteria bacterium]|nr:hypothetical protein [Pseudomonadota bacterium]
MSARPKLGDLLVAAGLIDPFQLKAALGEQKRWGKRLGVTLIKLGFATEDAIVRALARQLGLPVATLEGKKIHRDVLDLVPIELADKHMCLPLFLKEQGRSRLLFVAMEDPSDLAATDELAFHTGLEVKPVLMTPSEICQGIDRFYRGDEALSIEPEGDPLAEITAPAMEPEPSLPREPAPEPPPPAPAPQPGPVFQAPGQSDAAPAPAAPLDRASQDVLKAIAQLLVEKGLLGKDELMARVRALRDGGSGG